VTSDDRAGGGGGPDLEVSVMVTAGADELWRDVADPARLVTWSPEATAARQVRHAAGGAAGPGPLPAGATFSGSNRRGAFRWSTRCRVVESAPGAAYAFDVSYLGLAVARLRYAFSPVEGGTRVTEQWWDHRGAVMRVVGTIGTGVRDRRTHNEAGMRATLDRLAAAYSRDG
jgi:hypothetical protein